jgi:hypothetical protein
VRSRGGRCRDNQGSNMRMSGRASQGKIGEKEWCNMRAWNLGFKQLY